MCPCNKSMSCPSVANLISVCFVLFIHLHWHVTNVCLHVLQVHCQFPFLFFFLFFYCSCKVIIIRFPLSSVSSLLGSHHAVNQQPSQSSPPSTAQQLATCSSSGWVDWSPPLSPGSSSPVVVPGPSSVSSLTSPSRVPTIRCLPKASCRLIADKFSDLLEGVVSHNDVSSCVSLLSFATNCLYSPRRGERGGRWPPLLTNKLRMALGLLKGPSPMGAFLVNPCHCHLIISGRPCPRFWKKLTSGGHPLCFSI